MHQRLTLVAALLAVSGGLWAQDCPEAVGGLPYGPVENVSVTGSHALFSNTAAVQVVDVSASVLTASHLTRSHLSCSLLPLVVGGG